MSYHLKNRANEEQRKIDRATKNLHDWNSYSFLGPEVRNYPWAHLGGMDEWEYKLITVRGYFKDSRVFIKKEKDGKIGFSVFAPFVTGIENTRNHDTTFLSDTYKYPEYCVMVDLGWVPAEHVKEIEKTEEPLPVLEINSSTLPLGDYTDPNSGFIYKTFYNEDVESPLKFTELTAIVRRGESWNPLARNVNKPQDKLYQYVDLHWMTKLFGFENNFMARTGYLERIVPSLDEDNVYPIPATKDSFMKANLSPEKYNSWAKQFSLLSFGSVALIAPLLFL